MPTKKNDIELAAGLRTVVTRLVKKLRQQTPEGSRLSLTERSTIGLLDQHTSLLPSELAAMEKVTTQSMSQILNHLSELGLINRSSSATDRRKAIISLSKAGQAVLHKMRNEKDEWLHEALRQTCSARELDLLRRALPPLTRLIDFE
jgi:DNA-binding MarR family transcriptional regulator